MKNVIGLIFIFATACSSLSQKEGVKNVSQNIECFINEQQVRTLALEQGNQYLDNKYYDVIYDSSKVQPTLIEYKLKYSKRTHFLRRGVDYSNHFIKDIRVNQSASDKDYLRTGWDKGHLAPAEDFSFSAEAAKETFLYSNISPQNPKFNRYGSWSKLEEKIRKISSQQQVQIVTGPMNYLTRIPSSHSSPYIPEMFYKILFYEKDGKCFYEPFILKNSESSQDFCRDNFADAIPQFLQKLLNNKMIGDQACN